MQALLELNCFPSGMELFPAANETQWGWIKKVIDESDYYIVIVAGRYGTIAPGKGMSYTEMEYRYAVEQKKPVIGFLHEDISKIPQGQCEATPKGRDALLKFRDLVGSRLCKMYRDPTDLGGKVSRSITQLISQSPGIGWIRADAVSALGDPKQILLLRDQIDELKGKLESLKKAPEGQENLSQGDDMFEVDIYYDEQEWVPSYPGSTSHHWKFKKRHWIKRSYTWNQWFKAIAPKLIDEAEEQDIKEKIDIALDATLDSELQEQFKNKKTLQVGDMGFTRFAGHIW